MAGEINQHSVRTIGNRRERLHNFLWWLSDAGITTVDTAAMRAFFVYLVRGHDRPEGRWGNARNKKPVTSGTVKSYHSTLRTFFNWCVEEEYGITVSPMRKIPAPVDRPDQVQPFTPEQIDALLLAAKNGTLANGSSANGVSCKKGRARHRTYRDEAIFYLLLDTGIRASELCALTMSDIDTTSGNVRIRNGKGGKARTVAISSRTRRTIYKYINVDRAGVNPEEHPDAPLFISQRGLTAGAALTRCGLRMMILRWCDAAGIERQSHLGPHTFRHTHAVEYLRNGGSVFTLQQILGHTSVTQTRQYVALAQADITKQHALYSPVAVRDRAGKRR